MSEDGIGGTTPRRVRTGEQSAQRGDERPSALAQLLEDDGLLDLDEMTGPIHWPDLSANEAAQEWPALRNWVDDLTARFSHLDHHVIPRCWFLHNGHVEALSALRDQERINYGEMSPGTAGVDWHRAFRDVESRLREWTAELACGAKHVPRTRQIDMTTAGQWGAFVEEDIERRSRRAIDGALSESRTATDG